MSRYPGLKYLGADFDGFVHRYECITQDKPSYHGCGLVFSVPRGLEGVVCPRCGYWREECPSLRLVAASFWRWLTR
jgi:hypothetical protein